MADFGNDEAAFLLIAAIVIVAGLPYWLALARVSRWRRRLPRVWIPVLPIVALTPTVVVLSRLADPRVVGDAKYILLFLVGGAMWLTLAARGMALLGIDIRDDVVERDNAAALLCAASLLLAVGIAYATANIGSGPTIWTTLLPAAAATVVLVIAWLIIEFIGRLADAVTIDRDLASGIRTAGAMLAIALILGRAVGGDWISWQRTWVDFAERSWPAIGIAVLAGLVQRAFRPTPRRPRPDPLRAGAIPAAVFLATGVIAFTFTPNAMHPSRW